MKIFDDYIKRMEENDPTLTTSEVVGTALLALTLLLITILMLCVLWNWLMPIIFGLPKISIVQTIGLIALLRLVKVWLF